jgi:hypothetical protein
MSLLYFDLLTGAPRAVIVGIRIVDAQLSHSDSSTGINKSGNNKNAWIYYRGVCYMHFAYGFCDKISLAALKEYQH